MFEHARPPRGEIEAAKHLLEIPAYGSMELTHTVLRDVFGQPQQPDVVVVDNAGGYVAIGDEFVIRPKRNLGWAGASNLGFRLAFENGYRTATTLNNDTRLSTGYFAGLYDSRLPEGIGILAPLYTGGYWKNQATDYSGPPEDYHPVDYYRQVEFVDGTSLTLFADAWEAIGDLDQRTFGQFAWGADIDLCLRAKAAGFAVCVTERSLLHHESMVSASAQFGKLWYVARSNHEMKHGFRKTYGRGSLLKVRRTKPVRLPIRGPLAVPNIANALVSQ